MSATMDINMQCEQICLFFSAANLPHMPGTTDAFVSIHQRNNVTGSLSQIGFSEVVMDSINPHWTTHVTVDYIFESIQEIVVKVYHKHKYTAVSDSSTHQFLGMYSFTESALMMQPGQKLVGNLTEGQKIGKITIRGESVTATRDVLTCSFAGKNLAKKNGLGIFSKSDPFVQISRKYDDNTFGVVWKSPHVKNTVTPHWPYVRINMMPLCNNDLDRELLIELFDYNSSGQHKTMGSVELTLRQLLESNGRGFTLIEKQRVGSLFYSNSGEFSCINSAIENHPTLGQYIMGGMEMHLQVAIDFTASNGDPKSKRSLHRQGAPGVAENDYDKAIQAVGSIIEGYNRDHKFGVYGFGAKIKQADGTVSPTQHCFPVYGGESIVTGVGGILQAYHDALSVVEFSGPTNFGPLVNNAGSLASERGCTQDNQNYNVFMILTDGIIDDVDITIQSIIRASHTPLSIIIVGIGNEDFSDMSVLDADGEILEAGGAKAMRDIVQFVPFKRFLQKGPVALAQTVLAEIPNQVIKYMETMKIKPNEPLPPPPYEA